MKRDPLSRLFRNAAIRAREECVAAQLEFPTQARILAAWRSARSESDSEALLPLLRKALAAAAVMTVLAVALTLAAIDKTETVREPDEISAVTKALDEAMGLTWAQ
ncbi:MAG: hypothetical protein L0Y58_19535 [Verrucomicrobia subdivision 3 bacterium]|nr:hypothetical protein [Limisphaerales bacterium]